jgi:hypothetical protein
MPSGDEYCTRSPHLEGAEVIGSEKRKSDTSIGADAETHRPNTLNLFCPRVAQRTTRSHASPLPIIVEESSPIMLEVPPPFPIGMDFRSVTTIQESKMDEKIWHITRFPYMKNFHAYFKHSPKRFFEFVKLAELMEIKWLKLLKNVKTRWIYLIEPLRHIIQEYRVLLAMMKVGNTSKKKCTQGKCLPFLLIAIYFIFVGSKSMSNVRWFMDYV